LGPPAESPESRLPLLSPSSVLQRRKGLEMAALDGLEDLKSFLRVSCGTDGEGDVSCEKKIELLEAYAALLLEWNEKMNLVARSTLPDMWTRHFLDSAQMINHLPSKTKVLVDLGSGAGFPGLVLSIMGVKEVHLIESIKKKALFLEVVAKRLGLNVAVHNERIETIRGISADVVTARALTALPKLLSYAKPFLGEHSACVFLKGEKTPAELTEALKYWTFKYKLEPSMTSPDGHILTIKKLKVRTPHGSAKRNATY